MVSPFVGGARQMNELGHRAACVTSALCVPVSDWSFPVSQARWSPEQPALCGVRGSDGDCEEQRQGLLPRRAENNASHHGAAAAGPANGGEGAFLGAELGSQSDSREKTKS